MDEFDFQLQDALARRKAGREASMQFQMPQGQMVGRQYIRPSFGDALVQGLRMYQGQKDYEESGREIQELTKKRQTEIANALRNFQQMSMGTMKNASQNNPDYDSAMPKLEQAPNPREAYSALLQAPDASLRQAGMQGILQAAQQEQQMAERKRMMAMLQGMTPQQAIAAGVSPELVKTYVEAPNLGRPKVQYKDVGGQLVPVTEYGDSPAGLKPLEKTGNPFSDLLIRDASGQMVTNAPLLGAKSTVAAAGKPVVNVTNKIENKAAENIAGQIGPMLKESATAAEGAVRTLDAASRITKAVSAGNVISGPLANARLTARQIADLIGVGGRDNAEVLANTRATIRGLAEMTLQGRKQMSGQGAITESESKLAEKAMSGDISDLTPAEIKQLAEASERAAKWTVETHRVRSEAASQLPGMQGLMPFFNTPGMPGAPSQSPALPSGFRIVQ